MTNTISDRDRRKFPRIPVDIPIDYCLDVEEQEAPKETGYTVDVSPTGLMLKTRGEKLKSGQSLLFYPGYPSKGANQGLRGQIRWVKRQGNACLSGVLIEDTTEFFLTFLYSVARKKNIAPAFADSILDAFSDSTFLVDGEMRIISLSKNQPLVPIDRDKARWKKVTDIPSILKLFSSEHFNLRHDLQEVFYTKGSKQHRAISMQFGNNGEKEQYVFNVNYKYLNFPPFQESVLIQVRDVTALCKLRDKIEQKNRDLFEQYRFTLMGHIVDELLEDLISPLSAVVGRIDLLKMKMAKSRGTPQRVNVVDDWLKEIETIDGLVDQITQHCTIAAKRREREKLGAFTSTIEINSLVQETLEILSVHERFRNIDITLNLKEGLPQFNGEYFDWLNALIALLQCLSREMQTQHDRELRIETFEKDSHLVLAISHNAKALKMPLERESGLAIFDLIQKKYKTAIESLGGNGRQKISFYINVD